MVTLIRPYDGPNLHAPLPGVLVRLSAPADRGARLVALLKDAAQRAGIVLGAPEAEVYQAGGGAVTEVFFTTPEPWAGAEVARIAAGALQAEEAGDEDWDGEELLLELARRRRAEALPLAALQLAAEAERRGVPWARRGDLLLIGQGALSAAIDLAPLRARGAAPPPVAWERVGAIPIVVVSGGDGRDAIAARVADALRERGRAVGVALAAGFDATRALLADQTITHAVVALDPGDLLRRGLGIARCAASALVSLPAAIPSEAEGRAELARALGVPVLVTSPRGRAVLAGDDPEIAALAAYAPCPIAWVSGPPERWADEATTQLVEAVGEG